MVVVVVLVLVLVLVVLVLVDKKRVCVWAYMEFILGELEAAFDGEGAAPRRKGDVRCVTR